MRSNLLTVSPARAQTSAPHTQQLHFEFGDSWRERLEETDRGVIGEMATALMHGMQEAFLQMARPCAGMLVLAGRFALSLATGVRGRSAVVALVNPLPCTGRQHRAMLQRTPADQGAERRGGPALTVEGQTMRGGCAAVHRAAWDWSALLPRRPSRASPGRAERGMQGEARPMWRYDY
jgi:hypothetical protein